MGFTKAQQNAIDVKGTCVLVSAAAGSGKTHTLTHRIIKSIIEDGADISRMLVVTFTRAAATELRARISSALSNAIAENPENTRLQKQLILLGSAKICTIDSFFIEPVRLNFEKLGFSSVPRIVDEAELIELRERVLSEVLDKFYEKYNVCTDLKLYDEECENLYTTLLSVITPSRDMSVLIPTLYTLYKKLITSPDGVWQLRTMSERIAGNTETDFFNTPEGSIISDSLLMLCDYCEKQYERILCEDLPEKYISFFCDEKSAFTILKQKIKSGYAATRDAFLKCKFDRIPTLKADEKTPHTEKVKEYRAKRIKPLIKSSAEKLLFCDEEQIKADMSESANLISLLYDILNMFDCEYMNEKALRGICEFSDMPRFMLRLICNNDPENDTLNLIANGFDEVYIDEYQDVNEIQDKIFKLIGKNHRFMVGDIKQSIYGFREAEPGIFANYRKKFPIYDSEGLNKGEGCSIFMSENFRCDKNVIKFTNAVCSHILSACDSINYTSDDDLVFAKSSPGSDTSDIPVILNIIEKKNEDEADESETDNENEENEDITDEAIVTANEIINLLKNGRRDDGSKIQPSDICILVRSMSSSGSLTKALKQANIPYSVSEKRELFDGGEMKALCNLLEVIDNPSRDAPMYGVLTSDCFGDSPFMTLEEVISVRKSYNEGSLFDAVCFYGSLCKTDPLATILSHRCDAFVLMLNNLRNLSRRLSVDKLLRVISSNNYFYRISESSAFTYLYDCACKYVANSWNGLYSFNTYFENLLNLGSSGAESGGYNDGTVRIMTVHASKGLEFNTCFLYDFGHMFNFKDSKEALIYDRSLSLAIKLPNREAENGGKKSTLLRSAVAKKINQRQTEEEMRILYVALTRAKERIYISATLKNEFEKVKDKIISDGGIKYSILNCKNYISWIISAIYNTDFKDKRDVYSINVHKMRQIKPCEMLDSAIASGTENDTDELQVKYAKLLHSSGKIDTKEEILSLVPSRVAASKVSGDMLDKSIFMPFLQQNPEKPSESNTQQSDSERAIRERILLMSTAKRDFDSVLSVSKKPTAAERGSAAHLFLQYCDFSLVEKYGIDKELQRLVDGKFISQRTSEIINRSYLNKFFASEFFGMIRNSESIQREFHFGFFCDASEFTENTELMRYLENKKIYVQGSVDIILHNKDGSIYVCDYKTDSVSEEERKDRKLLENNMIARHKNQLIQYKKAIEAIYEKSPDKLYIYSMQLGEIFEVK